MSDVLDIITMAAYLTAGWGLTGLGKAGIKYVKGCVSKAKQV